MFRRHPPHVMCGLLRGSVARKNSLHRARKAESEAKKAAAAERWATARAAAKEARRRRDEETEAMRAAAGGKMAELEGRATSFRSRQKVSVSNSAVLDKQHAEAV